MLHINDLTLRIEGRVLIDHATVAIPEGHTIGLVGRNGTGKTTLFRAILGELSPETGSVSLPKRARIGTVAQEVPAGPETLIATVLAADKERARLMTEAETATDPLRIADIQTRLADMGAHAAPARAATILFGLGFPEAQQHRPCSDFSGGWRMRVALAALLFSEPDVLLLDEPTNYLDLEGTIWLESFLKTYPHTVLMVSHDRDLLNRTAEGIVHLDRGKLTYYSGNYDTFERTRAEKLALLLATKSKQDARRKHMQAFVDRFRYKASKARQAQSRLKMLERMAPVEIVEDTPVLPFHFPNPRPMAPPLIRLENVSVGYGDRAVLKDVDLRLDNDDRIALLGANGNGKSTFAKLLSGRLEPMSGFKRNHKRLEVGYFAQHQLDELTPKKTPYDHVRERMPDAFEAQVRARCGAIGFPGAKADTPAEKLSGGEKARLALALATFNGPQLLILDEPTNHLDMESRTALIEGLTEYEGAVILISHDRFLVETSADRLWLVADGTVKVFEGDMDDYRRLLLEPKSAATSSPRVAGKADKATNKAEQRREAARLRAEIAPLKRTSEAAAKRLAALEGEIRKIDQTLGDPLVFQRDPKKAETLSKERGNLVKAMSEAEEAWLAAEEAYEQARQALLQQAED